MRFPLSTSFHQDLQKVAEFGNKELPAELMDSIVEASGDYGNRCEIMTFLRGCFTGPTIHKEWRRVYGALVLVEDIMKRGDRHLLVETAEGHHFDVIQRLSFLEHFDNPDKRAQGLVRSKASTLRSELVPKLQNATSEGFFKDLEEVRSQGEASTCSPSVTSRNTMSTDASNEAEKQAGSVGSSPQVSPTPQVTKPTGRMILNGIVSVGHNEDTTDDSSGDEANPAPVQYRQAKPWKQANLSQEEPHAVPVAAQKTSVPTMDLLDL
jgi:hypothetical protein